MSFLKTFEGKLRAASTLPVKKLNQSSKILNLNLSQDIPELSDPELKSTEGLHHYIFGKIKAAGAEAAIGGYAEKRNLYRRSSVFEAKNDFRNIHLGIDIWMPAGTEVCAVLPGRIHSFADNNSFGDYGPTIILHHQVGNIEFYTLYGHLSRQSLSGLKTGQIIVGGQVIGSLGTADENVGWPPHLHFQVIKNMQGYHGDYPGVCSEEDSEFYLDNCPDPIKSLRLQFGIYPL